MSWAIGWKHLTKIMKHTIKRLDIMVAYSCNVSCKGCISVSDVARDGVASLSDIESWLAHWQSWVEPEVTVVFGGEPCLHPNLFEVCAAIRRTWPKTKIRLITNGYLLGNFFAGKWFDFEPFEMQISIHRQDHEQHINQQIKQILAYRHNWTVNQHGKDDHKQLEWSSGQFSIYKSIFAEFIQPYAPGMTGYGSDPVKAHAICGSPNTPILYKGLLYKCPPVANLMDLTDQDFYGYQPIAGQQGLDEFVKHIGCPELVCAWCPEQATAVRFDHFDKNNVQVKNKITG
jgi:hypothetical protein